MGQHEFIMRRTDSNGLGLLGSEEENKEALEDLLYNADLFIFIAIQEEVNTLE